MLHFFHVALFLCRTLFPVALFSCCTFCALILRCTFLVLNSSCVVLFPCYTFYVKIFSYCTFFVFYTFRVAFFQCYTFFMSNSFHVALFSCCTLFMLHLFSCSFMLHYFRVALSPCYTFSMLHFLHVLLFSCCTFFRVALFSYCIFFLMALFWNCTFFVMHHRTFFVFYFFSWFFMLHLADARVINMMWDCNFVVEIIFWPFVTPLLSQWLQTIFCILWHSVKIPSPLFLLISQFYQYSEFHLLFSLQIYR